MEEYLNTFVGFSELVCVWGDRCKRPMPPSIVDGRWQMVVIAVWMYGWICHTRYEASTVQPGREQKNETMEQ